MSFLNYAVRRVKGMGIPPRLLSLILQNTDVAKRQSLDYLIRTKLLEPHIMKDLLSSSSQNLELDLSQVNLRYAENGVYIEVPDSVLKNRDILSFVSLTVSKTGNIMSSSGSLTEIVTERLSVLSGSGVPLEYVFLERLTDNIFFLSNLNIVGNGTLRFEVTNDKQLKDLNPTYHHKFAKLINSGVKALLYNSFIMDLNEGIIFNGRDADYIENIVSKWEGEDETYVYFNFTLFFYYMKK